jgi:GTP pyrophosphokinase
MYAQVGSGILSLESIASIFEEKTNTNKFINYWKLTLGRKKKQAQNEPKDFQKIDAKKTFILREGNIEKSYYLGKCCNPIPGDDVIGYLNDNNTITIHKKSCPETIKITTSEGDRIVTAEWEQFKLLSYLSHISIKGFDRIGIVSEITGIISKDHNINMRSVKFDTQEGVFTGTLDLYVHNASDIDNIVQKLNNVKGVELVERSGENG